MRRLSILQCDEPVEGMDDTQTGRYCHRCAHAVHALDRRDPSEAAALLASSAGGGRVCVEFAVRRGRVVLAEGALAAFGAIAVGCAGHGVDEPFEVSDPEYADGGSCEELDESGQCEGVWVDVPETFEQPIACDAPPIAKTVAPAEGRGEHGDGGGSIVGLITDKDSLKPVEHVLVLVQTLDREDTIEVQTNEHGIYKVTDLAPGTFTVEVYYGGYSDNREVALAEAKMDVRANFVIDTTRTMMRGVVVQVKEEPAVPQTAAVGVVVEMD